MTAVPDQIVLEPDPGPGIRRQIIDLALDLSRTVAAGAGGTVHRREEMYFVSEASVYRLLKARPHHQPSVRCDPRRRTSSGTRPPPSISSADRLHLPQDHRLGMGTISRPCSTTSSRYIVAWKLCATMCVDDVTAALDLARSALEAWITSPSCTGQGFSPDNGSSYVAGDLAK